VEYFISLFDLSNYYGFDYLAAICAMTAMFLLGNEKKLGFLIYCFASSCGIVFSILAKSPPFIVTNIVMIVINLRGYLRWASN